MHNSQISNKIDHKKEEHGERARGWNGESDRHIIMLKAHNSQISNKIDHKKKEHGERAQEQVEGRQRGRERGRGMRLF